MLSGLFLCYAVIHLGIWLWGWRLWSRTGRPRVLLIVLLASTLLFYDNLRIGIGRFIGQGDLLYALSVPAFRLALVVAATAGHRSRCTGPAGGLALGAEPAGDGRLPVWPQCCSARWISRASSACSSTRPAWPTRCVTRRESRAAQLCAGSELVISTGPGPLVAIVTNIVVLAVGIALWIQRGWPWLTVGAGLMFIAAGAFASSVWSLPIANFGEICFTLAYIVTCAHFARQRL